ncbi:MAG: 2OG-Fe(II) oxygenase family protein [Caulobacterales bacterium]|nr:2OG-Fe(II) oxygenase family protein [Caulobacterales bacterium]
MRLFPTPVMHAPGVLGAGLVEEIVARARRERLETNVHSEQLTHTRAISAEADETYRRAASLIRPRLVEFGALLFGETLDWSVKEIWVNVMERGGRQAIHNHANSFISGVVYLTEQRGSSRTVFHKALGGSQYAFVNENKNVRPGPFTASRWQIPEVAAGDLILFPSYMLHEAPKNEGGERITMALNALPDRLDSWGYSVRFS